MIYYAGSTTAQMRTETNLSFGLSLSLSLSPLLMGLNTSTLL